VSHIFAMLAIFAHFGSLPYKVSQLTSSPCLPSSSILKPFASACTKDKKTSPEELFVYFGKKTSRWSRVYCDLQGRPYKALVSGLIRRWLVARLIRPYKALVHSPSQRQCLGFQIWSQFWNNFWPCLLRVWTFRPQKSNVSVSFFEN
jgi:hypothetical protein